jgi:group I intron endonuclease
MKTGIYKITNIVTGKVYVGSSIRIENRFKEHKYNLNKNIHHSKKLQNSYNKYGSDKFIFDVIEICLNNKIILYEREQYYIDLLDSYKNGYNMGAANINRSSYITQLNTKEKISKANKGSKNGMYGKTPWNKGKINVYNDETLAKMKQSLNGKIPWNKNCKGCQKMSNETNIKRNKSISKKIKQLTKNGDFIKIWDSAKECQDFLGIRANSISGVLHNKRKSAGGYRFEFV